MFFFKPTDRISPRYGLESTQWDAHPSTGWELGATKIPGILSGILINIFGNILNGIILTIRIPGI